MVKLDIIQPATGTYAVFRDTPEAIVSDPAVLNYLSVAWNTYMRSATIFVNDVRVFIDKRGSDFYFAYLADLSDAIPWQDFLFMVDDGTVPVPPPGGPNPPAPPPPNPPLPPSPVNIPPTLNGKPYRLILLASTGKWDSGATYPLCSMANEPGCQPVQFDSLAAAVDYSYSHNEVPYRVYSSAEAWAVVANEAPIDSSRILPPNAPAGTGGSGTGTLFGLDTTTLLILAGALLLLSKKGGS